MKEKKTKILLYHSYLSKMGGVETFTYNFCNLFKDDYDITLLYVGGNKKRLDMMKKLVKCVRYNKDKIYKTDIYIRNSVWGLIPYNIIYKYDIEMRHADYMYLFNKGLLGNQYKPAGLRHTVACSFHVAKMSDKLLGDNPKVLYNPLLPIIKHKKVYHFISFMRIDKSKGLDRMNKFYTMLKNANISFEWNIFTNSNYKSKVDEIHFWKARLGLENYVDYLVDADYSILLSDSEGNPYQVLESLQYNIPVIATDIQAIRELIVNGKNGYIIPLDMNFDINIIKKIPSSMKLNKRITANNYNWKKYLKEIEEEIHE